MKIFLFSKKKDFWECDLTIYPHNHTIQHAVGPHQVSWLDVLAQASPGSGRAVVLRTSLAIWLLWPGPHIGSGNPYPFAFRSPSFCLPAWSILDICRAWNDLEAQPGKDSLQCVTWDDLTGIDIFFLSVSLELSSLQTCCHLQCMYMYVYVCICVYLFVYVCICMYV